MSYAVGAGLRSDIRSQKSDIRCGTSWFHALQRLRSKPNILSRRGGSLRPPARKRDSVIGYGEYQNHNFHNRHKLFSFRTLLGQAWKSSGFRNPFFASADISLNKGVTRPYDRKHPLFSAATAMRKTYPRRI